MVCSQDKYIAATYYYAALNESEYAFAFSFSDTDKVSHASLVYGIIVISVLNFAIFNSPYG